MTHVPSSVLSKTPAELSSGAESNPRAKAAASRGAKGERRQRFLKHHPDGCEEPKARQTLPLP
jgi:hypothetical protein